MTGGGYVVTWVSAGGPADNYYDVHAQRFDANGSPVGQDTVVNTARVNGQNQNAIAALSDGGYIVTWVNQTASIVDVRTQRYDAQGIAVGTEMVVSAPNAEYSEAPAIAALPDGGYIVAFGSYEVSPTGTIVMRFPVQRFDADGAKVGSQATVPNLPAIAALQDGSYVLSWRDQNNNLIAQRYAVDGSASGPARQVNTSSVGSNGSQTVAALANGGYVVAWRSSNPPDGNSYIFAQQYDAAGAPVGGEMLIDQAAAHTQVDAVEGFGSVNSPTISALSGGGFIISWVFNGPAYTYTNQYPIDFVYARTYDASGAAQGQALVLDATHEQKGEPSVTTLINGQLAIVWFSDTQGSGLDVRQGLYSIQNVGTSGSDILTGSPGDDAIRGLAGNDTLTGLAGNDLLDGGTGADTMVGGPGNDVYYFDSAGDLVTELAGEGTDLVYSSLSLTLFDNVENLTLTGTSSRGVVGNPLDNIITGNIGNNFLDGGAGDDTLIGGMGDDTYVVEGANDQVEEANGGGLDLIQSLGTFNLVGYVENLTLTGVADVSGVGNSLDNTMTGNRGNNTFRGRAGNDTLDGGRGNDILRGNGGADTFVFGPSSGIDHIRDFTPSEGDIIDLSALSHGMPNGGGITVSQSGVSALINLGGGNIIVVEQTTATDTGFLSHIHW